MFEIAQRVVVSVHTAYTFDSYIYRRAGTVIVSDEVSATVRFSKQDIPEDTCPDKVFRIQGWRLPDFKLKAVHFTEEEEEE